MANKASFKVNSLIGKPSSQDIVDEEDTQLMNKTLQKSDISLDDFFTTLDDNGEKKEKAKIKIPSSRPKEKPVRKSVDAPVKSRNIFTSHDATKRRRINANIKGRSNSLIEDYLKTTSFYNCDRIPRKKVLDHSYQNRKILPKTSQFGRNHKRSMYQSLDY